MAGVGRRAYHLMVARLPWTIGNNELREYFTKFGRVKHCHVAFDMKTGFSKGFGFVDFTNPASAQSALQNKFHVLDGQKIEVMLKNTASRAEQMNLTDILETENT